MFSKGEKQIVEMSTVLQVSPCENLEEHFSHQLNGNNEIVIYYSFGI